MKDTEPAAQYRTALERMLRLPSIETQTVECFRLIREFGADWSRPYQASFSLGRAGFHIELRTGFLRHQDEPLWGLSIVDVGVAPRNRGRGWFRNYLELVYHAMPHDALVIENVANPVLEQALSLKQEYLRFRTDSFVRSAKVPEHSFDPAAFFFTSYENFTLLGGKLAPSQFCTARTTPQSFRPTLTWEKRVEAAQRLAWRTNQPTTSPDVPIPAGLCGTRAANTE